MMSLLRNVVSPTKIIKRALENNSEMTVTEFEKWFAAYTVGYKDGRRAAQAALLDGYKRLDDMPVNCIGSNPFMEDKE